MPIITSVNDILQRPFKNFNKEEQMEIVKKGRFTDLTNICQNDKGKYRMFAVSWYQRVKWLTGNTVNRKLYCWNCVLFPSGLSKLWNSLGFDDLKNLSQSIKKHEESKEHTYSRVKLKLFMNSKRSKEAREDLEINVKVKRNREYMERLIDMASALAHFEVPFRKDENGGFYKYLINIFKKYDDIVRTQIEESISFKGLTKTIQIDLIRSITHTIRQRIVEEVSAANFFALQVDEVTCSKVARQVAISIRYVKEACPVERFIGLYDVGYNKKSEELATIIERELEVFNFKEKLVAQCYDGGAVKSTEVYNIQQAIKRLQGTQNRCQLAHCYAYEFSTILAQSLRSIQECKLFFATIEFFATFFKNTVPEERQSSLPPMWTNSIYSCIVTLKNNQAVVLQALAYMATAEEYENRPIIIAHVSNLINQLKNLKFVVLLSSFHNFFSTVENSFVKIKKYPLDTATTRVEIHTLIEQLKLLKAETHFNSMFSDNVQQLMLPNMFELYVQVLDHIIYEIGGRFLDIEMSEFCGLINLDSLKSDRTLSRKAPDNTLLTLMKDIFPNIFDSVKLRSELDLLYNDPTIGGIGEIEVNRVSDIMKFIYDHDINKYLPMLYRLLELVVTVPSFDEPLEGSACVLNRIKAYCIEEKNEEPRGDLAFLTIEKDLFYEMEKTSQWYPQVIDYFSKLPSTSSIELIYKVNNAARSEKVETIAEPELTIKQEADLY